MSRGGSGNWSEADLSGSECGPLESNDEDRLSATELVCTNIAGENVEAKTRSDYADKESISPEHFRCCHGEDQARGMIANLINRACGRVSLRGMAWARHATFTAATGPKQYAADHSSSTGAYGGRERVGLNWRPGLGRVHHPSMMERLHHPSMSAGLVRSRAGT